MDNILFSVIMPVYNGEDTITKSIASVVRQEYANWELLVVNDGSTDDTSTVVKKIGDNRIRLVEKKNGGVSSARNLGLELAKGDFVCFLDADDIWLPGFLTTIVEMVALYPQCGVMATNHYYQDKSGKRYLPVLRGLDKGKPHQELHDYLKMLCVSDPPLHISAVAVKKDLMCKTGGFSSKIRAGEDTLTWIKLYLVDRIVYCGEPLSVYILPSPGERKVRTSDSEDLFENEIRGLMTDFPEKRKDILLVLSHWYKIRSSTYLQHGRNKLARKFALKAFSNSMQKKKLVVYVFLSMLPVKISRSLFIYLLKQ